ncbi:MAG: aldehyde dehydrogenase family protein [Acidimicrobiales bacterium]
MTVNGAGIEADTGFAVHDPATDEACGWAPECSLRQLDEVMEGARSAGPRWARDETARRDALELAAEVIDAHAEELSTILTAEQGKPMAEARGEAGRAAQWLRHYAEVEIPVEVLRDDEAERVEVVRCPVGVVAAITPWNAPLMLASWKLGPALRSGNTVVLKPSPFAPLATLRLGEILREVFPAGVLNVVSGGSELGASMSAHPVVRQVSFTGSVEVGKKVAVAAAADLKRTTLELGGNDAAIVLDDADPTLIAHSIFWSAFRNCGQVCSAIKRVYAPAALYDALVEELAAIATKVRVGPGREAGVELGPLTTGSQLDRVVELIDDARGAGGRVVAGGERLSSPGNFLTPAVVAGLGAGARLVEEEQFGPVLPIVSYDALEDALDQANASHYGLSGSVWGTDSERVDGVASRLECGRVGVNVHPGIGPDQPFGGWKWSGSGAAENGMEALRGYTEVQVRYTAKGRT